MKQSDIVEMVADDSPLSPFPKVRGLKNVFFFVSTLRSMASVWVMKSSSTSPLSEWRRHRLYTSTVACCEVFSLVLLTAGLEVTVVNRHVAANLHVAPGALGVIVGVAALVSR